MELLEIFFAHTISPVAIAVTSTIIYTIVAATLSPWMALALIAAHLVIWKTEKMFSLFMMIYLSTQ